MELRDGLTAAGTVLQLVDRAVARWPDHVAVRGEDGALTFAELWERSEQVALRLAEVGVKPGGLAGLCLRRSASLIVAALGVTRAGAAYVAIDPAYPGERIAWMLGDSGAAAVLADIDYRPSPGFDCTVVGLDGTGRLPGGELEQVAGPLPPAPEPADLAYVVYTSGSTGRPKGAMVEHAGLANLVAWHRSAFALGSEDRCTQIASPGFDASVWEIWPALASGAAVHVVPEALRADPATLRDWLVAEGITVAYVPTALAEAIIDASWSERTELRFLLTGGDALMRRPVPGLPFEVVNNYGLSETTVVATSGTVSPWGEGSPSIGKPIAGVVAEIVDERLEPVAPGEEGELLLGGAAVGRGYVNQPELTDERFLETARGRRYRTGDRVRLGASGEIEFRGRVDDQLSIRGFRVEPAEVMDALSAHRAIDAGAVVAAGGSSGERRLVAYLVGRRIRPEELSSFLRERLPEYMVPSRYVWVDRLPLTEHGKVDRTALPALVGARPAPFRPDDGVEATIAGMIASLLGLDEVGTDENFFLLGGHSMLGAQLIGRLENLYGVEITLRYLFDHPTPGQLTVEVERQLGAHGSPSAVAG